ncbi:ribosome silencing factor [bacterium]|nr:ribosome silencing factor [bacterium]
MNKELDTILKALDDAKLYNISLYDLCETNPFYNYVFIATASNKRQLQAALREIDEKEITYSHIEGRDTDWILVDADDILINVMTSESRDLYSLDNLYLNSKKLI